MNPRLARLQPYPFARQRELFAGIEPNPRLRPISLGIGEPKHPTPAIVRDALAASLDGLASYPANAGSDALRQAIAAWIARRYGIPQPDPATQVLAASGSREALFAFAQLVVDATRPDPLVVCPNPFYQIYEGATFLAGATPYFVNAVAGNRFVPDWERIPDEVWRRAQLVYVCTPANPTGAVMDIAQWETLFRLSDRHGFVIASDECYSEIYFDEAAPPLGSLQAARALGREGYPRLVMFSSLSKRSSVPGMRSGFVAGDAALLQDFLLYRTYHGSAMSPAVQAASVAAWGDEAHVRDNRRLYREKFDRVAPMLEGVLQAPRPEAGFFLWARTPIADADFARGLYRDYNVNVLPGRFLAREAHGVNPGLDHVRMALVPPLEECLEAAARIRDYVRAL